VSEQIVSGCINHKDLRHIRIYYDYMDIYQNNEHKAKIVRILETWTNHKRAEWYKTNYDRLEEGKPVQLPDFWITMSYGQFREFMRFTANEETIRKYLAQLEAVGHISRRINPDNPYGSPQYLLNYTAIQEAINKLASPPFIPDIPSHEYTPPGISVPPHSFTPTQGVVLPPPRGQNKGGRPPKTTPTQGAKVGTSNNIHSNHIDNTNDNNKDIGVSAIAPTPDDFSQDEDVSLQETVKVPAMPKRLPSVQKANDMHFQVSANGGKPSARQKKAEKPKEEPTPDEIELAARCSAWYKRLTEWCGGPLSKGGAVMNEHRCIKLLCQRYSDAQIDAFFTYLTNKDWKYSKVDNKFNVRGYILESEAGRVARILEESGKPVSDTPKSRPTALVSVEQAKINRERRDARIAALTAAGGR
jgi:hypothetical protein